MKLKNGGRKNWEIAAGILDFEGIFQYNQLTQGDCNQTLAQYLEMTCYLCDTMASGVQVGSWETKPVCSLLKITL